MTFNSFDDVQNHLDRLGLFHMDFGLDRMRRALAALGLTDCSCPVVQIVGTNGKGSTSTFLASLATAHGLKTGLYTSPHFLTPRERIRIDGRMLPPERWPSLASRVHAAAPGLTYFEFLTVLGLLAFAAEKTDLIVLETGLGGRYDATTAAPVHLICFTPVGMDHENVLGHSLAAIATDKAGAIRPMPEGGAVLTGPQPDEVMACLRHAARENGVPLLTVEREALPFDLLDPERPDSIPPLGLGGPHQIDNARLALAAWGFLGRMKQWPVGRDAILGGLAGAHLAGRFQYVPATGDLPPLILDGAHNPQGLVALSRALEQERIQPGAVIFSCLGDKNRKEMLPLVARIAAGAPVLVPTIQDNERAMSGRELAAELPGAQPVQRLRLALDAVRTRNAAPAPGLEENRRPVLVCGSLYLLGEFFTLYPALLERGSSPIAEGQAVCVPEPMCFPEN